MQQALMCWLPQRKLHKKHLRISDGVGDLCVDPASQADAACEERVLAQLILYGLGSWHS
jgi:hypothetical protein